MINYGKFYVNGVQIKSKLCADETEMAIKYRSEQHQAFVDILKASLVKDVCFIKMMGSITTDLIQLIPFRFMGKKSHSPYYYCI